MPSSSHPWLAPVRLAVAVFTAIALCFSGYHAAIDPTGVVNFFSYFTNLSNLAAVAVLGYGGWAALTGRPPVPGAVRGAVVLYPDLRVIPWVNDVVHRAMPLVVLVDWLIDPPARRIRAEAVAGWLVFPLVYLAYSLLRGHAVDWYAYPFLDPALHGGYRRVAGACALLAAVFLLIGAGIAALGNALAGRRRASEGVVLRRRHARA